MSRADWSFLEQLLEEGQEYSTGIGRVWLTVLFLFRMLVLGTAAESAWDDEQADFVCNTRQPGCTAVCYDKAFPISHFRYFVLQVILVSTPTIFYFGYVAIRSGKGEQKEETHGEQDEEGESGLDRLDNKGKGKEKRKEEELRKGSTRPSEAPKLKGKLLCAYAFSILLKVVLEVGFIVGLWVLYDGFLVAPKFECVGFPCPHKVDCFVSRPTEKTIFTIYTQAIAAISLLLNLLELLHLLRLAISQQLEKRYRTRRSDYLPRSKPVSAPQEMTELQTEGPLSYTAGSQVHLPIGEVTGRPDPCESPGDLAITVNWGPAEAESDLLPSYMNCLGAMRTTHSPKVHYKKHTQHTHSKSTKSIQRGHAKQKHYI